MIFGGVSLLWGIRSIFGSSQAGFWCANAVVVVVVVVLGALCQGTTP